MSVTDVERRRNSILQSVIETYVSTASPVGSEHIAKRMRSALSSATIRNVMMALEEQGLLEQPHTSAGRVPTDRGYRLYVDQIMAVPWMGAEQVREVGQLLEPQELGVEQLLARVSAVLSELTHQAGFVVAPTIKQRAVQQIELVPLSVRKVLCVLVAGEEMVASHVVEIVEPLSRDEAAALVRFINTELAGQPFAGLLDSLERRLLAERDSLYYLVKRSLSILQTALSSEPEGRLFLEGASRVVAQPEFARQPEKAQELLRWMDDPQQLLGRLRPDAAAGGVRVRIGKEVQLPNMEECSTITAPFRIGEEVAGAVGVLGPKRMEYPRLSALVEAVGRGVTQILSEWDAS